MFGVRLDLALGEEWAGVSLEASEKERELEGSGVEQHLAKTCLARLECVCVCVHSIIVQWSCYIIRVHQHTGTPVEDQKRQSSGSKPDGRRWC